MNQREVVRLIFIGSIPVKMKKCAFKRHTFKYETFGTKFTIGHRSAIPNLGNYFYSFIWLSLRIRLWAGFISNCFVNVFTFSRTSSSGLYLLSNFI